MVTGATGSIANNGTGSKTVTCPSGYLVVGGGGQSSSASVKVAVQASFPASTTSWTTTFANNGSGAAITATVYAICAQ
jgi:hypothetical protein